MKASSSDPRVAILAHLSPSGRLSPRAFLLGVAAPVVVLAAALTAWGAALGPVGWLLATALHWAYMVGLTRRLQDLGLPGLRLSAPAMLVLWLQLVAGLVYPAWLDTYVYVWLAVLSLFAASTTGQRGANRYGPDPLARAESAGAGSSPSSAAAAPGGARA